MAYPEPTPAIKGKDAKIFLKRLDEFELTSAQKEMYRGTKKRYLRSLER
jgi:hypothetical protein